MDMEQVRLMEDKLDVEPQTAQTVEGVASITTWLYDRSGLIATKRQWVIEEKPVTLHVNGRELLTLLCAGHHLEEMAAGFCHAEGFLRSLEDLVAIEVDAVAGAVHVRTRQDTSLADRLREKRTVTSGCGKGSIFYYSLDALLGKPVVSSLRITPEQILARVEDLHHQSETYRRTHGVHNTALAEPERIVLFRNDIGRHNAVDMIVGHGFLRGIPFGDKLLLTTGRLTSEILIKCAKVGIAVLVSRNTATTLAIELAKALNITLIGYVRGGKFTVYSGRERLIEPAGFHEESGGRAGGSIESAHPG
jgi:FdhD protein